MLVRYYYYTYKVMRNSNVKMYILGAVKNLLTLAVFVRCYLQDVNWVKHFVERPVMQLAENLDNASS